jgi:hypothetical protein
MKHFVLISAIALVLLSSCATNKMATYSDDVYANPAIERAEDAKIAAIQKAKEDAYRKRYNDSINNISLAQKAKDDANPYYKDREFKYDDYYDYEYATRVKRFDNSISGLGYYDNYYTNSYWYNKNPYNYGVSVYNGYSWWGNSYNNYSYNPSVNFYNNNGWGCNSNYGYNGYNPYMSGYSSGFSYGYNFGYNNGYYGNSFGFGYGYNNGYGYNPYGYNGYNNGYNNNGWGYYNGYDHNSSYTYGPRSSHGGGNDRKSSNPGMRTTEDSYYNIYTNAVVEKQEKAVKFEPISSPKSNSLNGNSNPVRNNNGNYQTGEIKNNNPIRNPENSNAQPGRNNANPQEQPIRIKKEEPVKQPPIRIQNETPKYQQPSRPYEPKQQPNNNGGNSQPSNNGGNSQPSNNGGSRPR